MIHCVSRFASIVVLVVLTAACATAVKEGPPKEQTAAGILRQAVESAFGPVTETNAKVVEEGSLASETLVADTIVAMEAILERSLGNTKISKFVLTPPTGEVGSRSWVEMWIVGPPEDANRFYVSFTETGNDAADFSITAI